MYNDDTQAHGFPNPYACDSDLTSYGTADYAQQTMAKGSNTGKNDKGGKKADGKTGSQRGKKGPPKPDTVNIDCAGVGEHGSLQGDWASQALDGFDAMAQAAKSHVSKAPKQVRAPAEMEGANYVERNPYRLENEVRAWATDGQAQVPLPWAWFEEACIPRQLHTAFQAVGFRAPSPIQAQVWPVAMEGWDVIGIAKTGSGKTLGFLVPSYTWMSTLSGYAHGPRVLILAPTRELATQIHDEATKFARASGFFSACVYGGASKREQLSAMRSGAQILVATPGRLNDFLESNQVNLSSVGYLVFDEADRMLDMGFEPQIRDIVKRCPRQRQTLMFSATWPEEVQTLAHDFLNCPMHVQVGDPTELQANADIKQQVMILSSNEEKDGALVRVLRSECAHQRERTLVFVAMKKQCDQVERMLRKHGIYANTMHSDKDQQQREEALQQFRSGAIRVLIATDVAARGLDIKGIGLVINYDAANNTEDHVHRIGRTGRAGEKGRSVTFLTRSWEDAWKCVGIAEVMEKADCAIPHDMRQIVDRVVRKQQQAKLNEHKWDDLPKVLMVAEKPSVAKMVAEHLSGGRFRIRRGQSRAVQIFEFTAWFPPAHQKCRIMQTSTIGHVFGLDFKYNRVPDIADLFWDDTQKTIEDNSAKNRIVEHLQELGNEAEYLALWLDCDREGENICFEVISVLSQSHGEFAPENIYRAHFSALTEPEITGAFHNLKRPDKNWAQAVDARQELDLKIGCTFTRLMTRTFLKHATAKFRLKDQTCLSYGPCQTPTLWFCVQRHHEIQDFQRQEFYKPMVLIDMQGWPLELEWVKKHTFDHAQCQAIEQKMRATRRATFKELRSTQKTVRRPVGLNTVQLLKAASTGLGMSPVQCMRIAEGLYTAGYISYPRTETTKYSDTFDLTAALREQADHPSWGRTVVHLLRQGRIRTPASGNDRGDHPPITPMKAAPRDEFRGGKEWRLYDYVTRHFIASLMDDMTYTECLAVYDVGGEEFGMTYHEISERGFLFAMPWKAKDSNLNELDWEMPRLRPGTQMAVQDAWVETRTTQPPDYLKESELVALMDRNGIGTDASIPQHIQNICDRHYVMVCGPGEDGKRGEVIPKGGKKGQKGKGKSKGKGQEGGEKPQSRHMVPSPLGLSFCAAFQELDKELCQPEIRAFMERQVSQVADGILEKDDVVAQNIKLFSNKFNRFRENIKTLERYFVPRDHGDSMGYRYGGCAGDAGGWSNEGGGGWADGGRWAGTYGKGGGGGGGKKGKGRGGRGAYRGGGEGAYGHVHQ